MRRGSEVLPPLTATPDAHSRRHDTEFFNGIGGFLPFLRDSTEGRIRPRSGSSQHVFRRAPSTAKSGRYAGSNLLCYLAQEADTLVARQAHALDPVLRWAAEQLRARCTMTAGVMYVAQPPEALAAIGAALDAY